jgi:ubiquinone/menaquinone biosynthesis C-methylase UbiE
LVSTAQLKNQTREAYDWIAENYATEWVSRIDQEILRRFLEIVLCGSRVLDVGCGPAHYAKAFSENGLVTFGIDVSFGMLTQAARTWQRGRIAQMDMQTMGFPSRYFDALWACTSFAHIPESAIAQTLTELKRLLKVDGVLFINATINSPAVRIEAVEEIKGYGKQGRFYQRYPNPQHFENYLLASGFTVIDIITRTVYSGYNSRNTSTTIVPKDEYKVNQWANFYCRNVGE